MSLDTYLKHSSGIGDFTACSNELGTAGTVHRAFYFYDESV